MCWRDYVHNDNLVSRDIGIVDRIGCDILIGSRNNISADVKRYTDFMKVCCELNLEFLPPNNWIKIEKPEDVPQGEKLLFYDPQFDSITEGGLKGTHVDSGIIGCSITYYSHWRRRPEPPRE